MTRPQVVWLAGMRWDGQEGTEVRLARALGRHVDVLWFDPVASWVASRRGLRAAPGRTTIAPGVTRVATVGFPGVTRPGLSVVAQRRLWAEVSASLRGTGRPASAVLLSDPTGGFPRGLDVPRVLFVTDDWPAGARMMGVPSRHLERHEHRNATRATAVTAVSPELARTLAARTGVDVTVVANGCEPHPQRVEAVSLEAPAPRAGLMGTINERLDLDILEAVADRSVELVLVGPLTARSAEFRSRFEALVARPNVWWEGACAAAEVPAHLAAMSVGLTPYADNPFNRGSFPLKTLEYLAAGLSVVSTTLPANAWLGTDLVQEAATPDAFADAVARSLARHTDDTDADRRRRFAHGHTWDARAVELLRLIGLPTSDQPATAQTAPDQTAPAQTAPAESGA